MLKAQRVSPAVPKAKHPLWRYNTTGSALLARGTGTSGRNTTRSTPRPDSTVILSRTMPGGGLAR